MDPTDGLDRPNDPPGATPPPSWHLLLAFVAYLAALYAGADPTTALAAFLALQPGRKPLIGKNGGGDMRA